MIVANLVTQFANNLGSIIAGRILAEKFNTDFAIHLPYNDKIYVSEFDLYVDWSGQEGYDRLYNRYEKVSNEFLNQCEELVISDIDEVEIDPNKNYVINKFLFYGQMERHIDFIRKEYDFILNNPNNDNEYLKQFKDKTVFYYRTNFGIYLRKYDKFTELHLRRKLKIHKNFYFVTDNKMTLSRYLKEYKIYKNVQNYEDYIIKHDSFLTDFLILVNCKEIYSIASSSFSAMASLLGGVPISYVNYKDTIEPEKLTTISHVLKNNIRD